MNQIDSEKVKQSLNDLRKVIQRFASIIKNIIVKIVHTLSKIYKYFVVTKYKKYKKGKRYVYIKNRMYIWEY